MKIYSLFLMRIKDTLLNLLPFALSLLVYFLAQDVMPEAPRRVLGIFTFAVISFSFEIYPIYVTSLMIVLLLCFALAKPGGVLGMDQRGYTKFLLPFASPVILLFFGGFILAESFKKHGLDQTLLAKLSGAFKKNPLYALFFGAYLLSMWISNTAAMLIMMSILKPKLSENSAKNVKIGALLGIAFASNLGGIALPIGSPPNALAIGFLSDVGIFLSFFSWMLVCLPLSFLFFLFLLVFLHVFYLKNETISIGTINAEPLSKDGKKTLAIALFTALMWLLSPLHGIPEAMVALLSVSLLMVFSLIDRDDIKRIDWDILILMWGGLSLGVGIEESGLNLFMEKALFSAKDPLSLGMLFLLLSFFLSIFISNTAAAALLMPLALQTSNLNKPLLIFIAIACSLAMILPVSTPPNAIAFSSRIISQKEMAKGGAIFSGFCFTFLLVIYLCVSSF